MARKSAVPGLPAASDLTLDEFLEIYPPLAGADGDPDPEPDPADPADPDPEPDPEPAKEPDWKAESRKHEGRAKKSAKEAADLAKKLADLESKDKSEQEKAIDKARADARAEAMTEAEQERRSDRLEVQVTRIASKGVQVGEKTVKFADTDDALLRIERGIKSGDIDADDIFNAEGKVQTDALTTALQDILQAAPHLGSDTVARQSGSSDAGKGGAPKDATTPAEHLERILGKK